MGLVTTSKYYGKTELFLRWGGIFLLGAFFPVFFSEYDFLTLKYFIQIAISVTGVALLWNGCPIIVDIIVYKYDGVNHMARTIFLLVVIITAYTLILSWLSILAYKHFLAVEFKKEDLIGMFVSTIVTTLFITTIYGSVFFFKEWKKNLLRNANLERDNVKAQFESLKTQVNPHFLFNSLNTLMSLVGNNKVALTYIQDLSAFLRYVLQTGQHEVITLQEEVEICQKYAQLQKLRFENKLNIQFNIDENSLKKSIPPLALQMLIENAIKHNVISQDKPLLVEIFVENDASLVVKNNLQLKLDESGTGIGLKNIKNRYSFLSSTEVEIIQTNAEFIAKLPLLQVEPKSSSNA